MAIVNNPNSVSLFGDQDPFMNLLTNAMQQNNQPNTVQPNAYDEYIKRLIENRDKIAANQALQAQKIGDITSAATARPSSRFMEGDQGFLDALKNPSESQRIALIQFGLGLAGADSTKDLSQRLALALVPGIQSMQATRQQDVKTDLLKQQGELQKLQLQGQGLTAEAGFDKDLAGLELKKQESMFKMLENQRKSRKLTPLSNTFFGGTQVFQDYDGNVVLPSGQVLSENELSQLGPRPNQPGTFTIGEGGALTYNAPANKEMAKVDSKFLQRLREEVVDADKVVASLTSMEQLLDVGIKTGPGTGIRRGLGRTLEAIEGATGLNLPTDGLETQAQYGDLFETYTKSQGILNLANFGGSDTERELQVSLEVQPNVKYSEKVNRAIIANKRAAIEILASKETFYNQWLNENGSLTAENQQGQTAGQAWRQFQKDNFTMQDITGIPENDLKKFNDSADINLKTKNRVQLFNDDDKISQALRIISG